MGRVAQAVNLAVPQTTLAWFRQILVNMQGVLCRRARM
jgi:hypothetical protein